MNRNVQSTLVHLLWSFSTITTLRSSFGILHTSLHQRLSIPRQANLQTRLVLLAHAYVYTVFLIYLLLTISTTKQLRTSTIPYFPDPVHTSTSPWSSLRFSNPASYYTGGPISSLFRYVLHSTFLGSFIHKRLIHAATNVFESWGGWTGEGSKMADMGPRIELMWSES